jgi:hypothetical protein
MISVGHHFYYSSLDNTLVNSVDQQTWAIRIGTGFVNMPSIALSFTNFRRRVAHICCDAAIPTADDRKVNILTNPNSFLIPDLWMYAKTLILLAIISWCV